MENAWIEQNRAHIGSGGVICGPYIKMTKGVYRLRIKAFGIGMKFTVTADSGLRLIKEKELTVGTTIS